MLSSESQQQRMEAVTLQWQRSKLPLWESEEVYCNKVSWHEAIGCPNMMLRIVYQDLFGQTKNNTNHNVKNVVLYSKVVSD